MSGDNQKKSRADLTRDLFEQHASDVARFLAAKLGRDERAIEDLSQETWTRFLRPPPAPVENDVKWLYGIADNVAKERLYAEKRDREHCALPPLRGEDATDGGDPSTQFPDPGPSPEEVAQRHRSQQLLDEAVSRMNPLMRAVYVFRDVRDLSMSETAAACRMTEDQVKRHLRQAREHVAKFMAREGEI